MNNDTFDAKSEQHFQRFVAEYRLNKKQSEQFRIYITRLLTAREQFNLTAIDTIIDTLDYHFKDSLALAKAIDTASINSLADVGTGGGFPGIPLKICFPHLAVVLIEVTAKKVEFLKQIIQELELENIEVVQLDWRTFLRKTRYLVDLFVSRASLHTDELVRLFQPSCPYKHAELVYWASEEWQLPQEEKNLFLKEYLYRVGNRKRKLIFFKLPLQ